MTTGRLRHHLPDAPGCVLILALSLAAWGLIIALTLALLS